jgi:DNA primase catalytic subunit
MRVLEDALGQDLKVGDQIVYTTRRGSHMNIRRAVIRTILDHGEQTDYFRYSLAVSATRKLWSGNWYTYNVQLYSNTTIVRINTRKQNE